MAVENLSEKLNYKYGSKIAWKADDYIIYKAGVETARIGNILGLIEDFSYWAALTEEEEKLIGGIIESLKEYKIYLLDQLKNE